MASARITCPECKSVLRPAKPVPDGKKVKCPECANVFTTPGLIEEDEPPRPRPAAKKKSQAGVKKADGGIKKGGAAKPPPPKSNYDDDDEDAGIYSFVGANEATAAEEEERPEIVYAPDMSIKDLRGPAQEAVVKPSNYMLLLGGINSLADVFLICYMFWPMVFAESVFFDWQKELMKHYQSAGSDKNVVSRVKGYQNYSELKGPDLEVMQDLEQKEKTMRFIQMGAFIAALIYNGIAIFGTVKMQNIESRGWGIAASIMLLLPMGSAGTGRLIFEVFHNTIGDWIMDENLPGAFPGYSVGLAVIPYLLAIYVSVMALRVLFSQKVIDGFNYIAD